MNKYKDYLEQAYKEYKDFTMDELLDELKVEKHRLELAQLAYSNEQYIRIWDEHNKNLIAIIYGSSSRRKRLFAIIFEELETNIKMLKAIIYDKLLKGEYLEDEENEI